MALNIRQQIWTQSPFVDRSHIRDIYAEASRVRAAASDRIVYRKLSLGLICHPGRRCTVSSIVLEPRHFAGCRIVSRRGKFRLNEAHTRIAFPWPGNTRRLSGARGGRRPIISGRKPCSPEPAAHSPVLQPRLRIRVNIRIFSDGVAIEESLWGEALG